MCVWPSRLCYSNRFCVQQQTFGPRSYLGMLLNGKSYLNLNLRERRTLLEKFARPNLRRATNLRLSPATTDYRIASGWFRKTGRDLDGIIAKRLDTICASGERTAAVKVKQIRTADCVVGGYRYATGKRVIGSLLLGLYGDDGLLHHVGFISGFKASERRALTEKFERLRKPPGFTGNAPGGTSRWSTERTGEWEPVDPKIVVEVAYDHFYRQPLSTRHKIPALAFRQRSAPVHDGPGGKC
jgi:ATP-dependent DNA ligase